VFDRSGEDKGRVHVGINLSEENRVEAELALDGREVNGIFSSETGEEVMELEEIADTFREQASKNWTVGDIRVAKEAESLSELSDSEGAEADNAELYRLAKVFLEAVRSTAA
jgi:hypothetical protein